MVRNPKHVCMLPPGCITCEIKSTLKGDCEVSRLHTQNGKELAASKEATEAAVLQRENVGCRQIRLSYEKRLSPYIDRYGSTNLTGSGDDYP